MPNRRTIAIYAGAVLFAAITLWLWQLFVDRRIFSAVFVASPSSIIEALLSSVTGGALWKSFGATVSRLIFGWLLGALLGLGLGTAIGHAPNVLVYLRPMLAFFRRLPAAVFIPPALLLVGPSESMAVMVIAFGVMWPVLLAALDGFTSVEPQLHEVAASLEFGWRDELQKFALPAALPGILAGARMSLALALILTLVVEMQADSVGMGNFLLLAQRSFRAPDLYAGIVVLGVLGLVLRFAGGVGRAPGATLACAT